MWIEPGEYADAAAYDRDQRRGSEDKRMKALLAEWREMLEAPPTVQVYQELALSRARGRPAK